MEIPIEFGSASGENWRIAYLVGGKVMVLEELVGSPSFDSVSWVTCYLAAYRVTAFPDDLAYFGSYLAACPMPASRWDCLACLRKDPAACRVAAFLAACCGVGLLLITLLAFLCSFQVGGL